MIRITLSFFVIMACGYSQAQFSFEEVLDEPILVDFSDDQNVKTFYHKVYSFVGHEMDSIDLEILCQGPVVGSLLIKAANDEDTLTYRDLYDIFQKLKREPFYHKARDAHFLGQELFDHPADLSKWDSATELLKRCELTDEEISGIRKYVMNNPRKCTNLGVALREYKKVEKELTKEPNKRKLEEILRTTQKINLDSLLTLSAEQKKPIILYFTGFACVNCRKMEMSTFSDTEVLKKLTNEVILVPLHVDDRTELPQKEQKEIELFGRTRLMKTVGDANMYYQIETFDIVAQPYLVALNSKNEVLGVTDYPSGRDPLDFLKFLADAIEKFYH